jgi:predicted DNA-binding protein
MPYYSGNSGFLTARIPIELIERMDAKAQELGTSRSMIVRQVLEMIFLEPRELTELIKKENAIRVWLRSGAKPEDDPEAEWNPDHKRHAASRA